MNTIENIMTRKSIRKYTDKIVSEEDIKTILKAGMAGPSAVNARCWKFVIVENKEKLAQMHEINGAATKMLPNAAFAILVCGDLDKAFKKHPEFWVIDCSIATQNMILAANELGIGSVWLGTWPMEAKMEGQKKLFDLPDNLVPHSIVAFGYPDEDPDKSSKPEYEEDKVIFVK